MQLPEHNYILIMAGGAGTRLWPISRSQRPKQFQRFVNGHTLLQHMVEISTQTIPLERVFVMAIPEFSEVILEQIPGLPSANILFEPDRRDNGPAITLGMVEIHRRDPQASVAILWSDHFIQETANFAQMLSTCFEASRAHPTALVTVGTNPTSPDTGLGYIQMDKQIGEFNGLSVYSVKKFIEKPDQATANTFINKWEYLWNAGYKVMGAGNFLALLKKVKPDLAPLVVGLEATEDEEKICELYAKFPKLSIEYLFTQYLSELLVVPADIGWSDIGNWNTLHDILKEDGNKELVTRGEVIEIESSNTLVYAKDRPIAVVGVEDLIIVDEGDVILVMSKKKAQEIKTLTKELEHKKKELL